MRMVDLDGLALLGVRIVIEEIWWDSCGTIYVGLRWFGSLQDKLTQTGVT
jgi:hypothetical protein